MYLRIMLHNVPEHSYPNVQGTPHLYLYSGVPDSLTSVTRGGFSVDAKRNILCQKIDTSDCESRSAHSGTKFVDGGIFHFFILRLSCVTWHRFFLPVPLSSLDACATSPAHIARSFPFHCFR